MKSLLQPEQEIFGEYEIFLINPDGSWEPKALFKRKNLILFSWGFAVAKALGQGDPKFKISAAYIEYKNVATPATPVTIPAYGRENANTYYSSLPSGQDFLRVPIAGTPTIDIGTGYSSHFIPGYNGNRITVVAQTAGTVGFLGRPFSNSVNSKIFGIALVATPVFADYTQDVIISRGYFDQADQIVKPASSQIGIRWRITFG